MNQTDKPDPILTALIVTLLLLLSYAGYLSYKSIDWKILDKLEAQPLILPTPVASSSASTNDQVNP